MRDFSWQVFTMTGDVDAYMLYKEMQQTDDGEGEEDEYSEDLLSDNGLA